MGDVIELFGSQPRPNGWTEQEKAELYRAAALLGARGLPFDSEFGSTDEGDPWFLFIGRGTGEVLAHFARIGGTFVVHHSATDALFESRDIRDLVDRVLVSSDRSVGRASGDAFYSHLAVTTAALALSLESLSSFVDGDVGAALLADTVAQYEQPADTVAAWLLEDQAPDQSDGDDSVIGVGGPDWDGADAPADPQDRISAVEVDDVAPAEPVVPVEVDAIGDRDSSLFGGSPQVESVGMGFVPVPSSFDGVVLIGDGSDETIIGTSGADFLIGADGRDLILGGAGDDVVLAGRGDDTVLGGEGDDVLVGGEGNDQLHGGPGDDLLLGGAGDDLMYGGKGDDTLQGYAGRDTLSGDSGDDLLIASDGDAVLIGGDGTNIFHFAPGTAIAYGGVDRDIFVYEEGERSDVVIRGFDPDEDELYYLDPSGLREFIDVAADAADGQLVIEASLGGKLTILFDDPDPVLA